MAEPQPSVLTGVFGRPFPEQVAFFRGKLGNLVPTQFWDDLLKAGHDTGFMVAGAQKADLLADLAAAVDRAIAAGTSIETFRKDFRAIVARHGWTGWTGEKTAGGRAWRTRVIYTTNAQTSYAAGRLAQLRAGNFALWIYQHNDSVQHPRPLHLAWDNITLPPEHPFWRARYPPSGWGCRCYIVGARSARGARRLGGDPDKALPDGWDTIDPKTGEPPGIDKGWGYMPGATVSDTVNAMAAKTQQWEYTLAKAYMQGVPDTVRDALAIAYRGLPSVADDVRRYAQRVLAGRTALHIPPYRTLGLITQPQAASIARATRLDIRGYDFAVDPFGVKHVRGGHGAPAETLRGQVAVTSADYAMLPRILNAADRVQDAGVAKATGRRVVRITAVIDGRTYVTIWEVRGKRRSLVLQSFWIAGKVAP